MPIFEQDYLKIHANRCLLILISDSQLDEFEVCRVLSLYSLIKKLQLTPDRRAAFVDFECEHAPLLAARCFELRHSNPEVPFPKGVTAFLPGCSVKNFLFLQFVPRSFSTEALRRHFTEFNHGLDVKVYRPGTCDNLSSRVVVELNGMAAFVYTKYRFRMSDDMQANGAHFHAIPTLKQLTDIRKENDGCASCRVADDLREYVKTEGRDGKECHTSESLNHVDDGYSTLKAPKLILPSIEDDSEKNRWGMCGDNSVSPAPVNQSEQDPVEIPPEREPSKNFPRPPSVPYIEYKFPWEELFRNPFKAREKEVKRMEGMHKLNRATPPDPIQSDASWVDEEEYEVPAPPSFASSPSSSPCASPSPSPHRLLFIPLVSSHNKHQFEPRREVAGTSKHQFAGMTFARPVSRARSSALEARETVSKASENAERHQFAGMTFARPVSRAHSSALETRETARKASENAREAADGLMETRETPTIDDLLEEGEGDPLQPVFPSPSPIPIPSVISNSTDHCAPQLRFAQRSEGEERKEHPFSRMEFARPPVSRASQSSARGAPVAVKEASETSTSDALEKEGGDTQSTIGTVASESGDAIVEESVIEQLPEMPVYLSGEIEKDPQSHAISIDASEVIVEESDSPVGEKEEEVVVEEKGEEEDARESSKSLHVSSEDEDERDSDDLLSGEEDQWKSVGHRSFPRLSHMLDVDSLTDAVKEQEKEYEVAAGDAPELVMTMEEEVDDGKKESQKKDAVSSVYVSQEQLMPEEREESMNGEADPTENALGREEKGALEEEVYNAVEDDDEDEMKMKEGEQRDDVLSLVAPFILLRRTIEVDSDDEVALEMEEEGGKEGRELASSAPIRHWSRASVVDQEEEEDYRSM